MLTSWASIESAQSNKRLESEMSATAKATPTAEVSERELKFICCYCWYCYFSYLFSLSILFNLSVGKLSVKLRNLHSEVEECAVQLSLWCRGGVVVLLWLLWLLLWLRIPSQLPMEIRRIYWQTEQRIGNLLRRHAETDIETCRYV